VLLAADDLTVEDCAIVATQLHAISTDTSFQTNRHSSTGTMIKNIVLKNNMVDQASLGGDSQAISLIADGFAVTGNTVRDSKREGIDIWLGARRGEVTGNTVYGNAATGIYVDGASFVKIYDNVVYDNRGGIGVSSESVHYKTNNIWVYDNVVYDNREGGVYLWDDKWRPGYKGVQDILVAHNTMVGNKYAIFVSGENITARILNNLGYATKENVQNDGLHTSLVLKGNVWLTDPSGFVSADRKDFHLTKDSPAIDKGVAVPTIKDGSGGTLQIDTDFDGSTRILGSKPDAGAFEFREGAKPSA